LKDEILINPDIGSVSIIKKGK